MEFIRFLEDEVVTKFGAPLVLISDRGTCFTSFETYEYFEKKGITHSTSPPYFPESNGLAERAVKTLKDTLRRQMNGIANWKSELSRAIFAVNTSFNASIGFSPFEMLFGFQPQIENELLIGSVIENKSRMEQIEEMKRNRIQSATNLKISQERQEKSYNEKRSEATFQIGEKVLFTTGNRRGTFNELFEGPFVVNQKIGKRMYRIQREDDDGNTSEMKVAPAERLKSFVERKEDYGIEECFCCLNDEYGIDHKKTQDGRRTCFEDETNG
ncbi:uncharacterized protein B4U80_11281, partial [Leptotrombidium deliense]